MQSINLKITGRWKQWLVPLGLCVLLLAGPLAFGGGVLRSRVYNLRHITSEQARDLFSQLNIGQSYNLLTPDVLIVTSNVGPDLVRATEIISVLDQTPLVQIRTLMVASEGQPLPPLDEFFATLGSISAGTMTEAPPKGADRPAIIDVLGDELVAIAAEDVLIQVETAIDDWKKDHPASTSEDQAAPDLAVEQISEKSLEGSSTQVDPKVVEKPEKIAEPNVPELTPEPNDLADAVLEIPAHAEPVVAEEAALAPVIESQQASQKPIEEIAQQVFETQLMADANTPSAEAATEYIESPAEPNAPADVQPQEEVEEDFLNEGLLEVLAEAEQVAVPAEGEVSVKPTPEEAVIAEAPEKAKPEQTDDTPKPAAAEEPVQLAAEEDDPMKTMRTLLAQAKAEEEQVLAAQKAAEVAAQLAKSEPLPPAEDSPLAGGELNADTLQAELALLRQKLAELETRAAEEAKPVPVDAADSKVQIAEPVRTEPQIDPKLAEKQLETVIDLPQEVELEALIDLVGKQLGLNYMYDPTKLKGQKVQLKIHGGKIKVKDTYALLESVLRFKGFVMTRRDELVTILPQADIAKAEPVLRGADDPIQPGDIIVSSLFELKHIDAASAQAMLEGMNLGTAFSSIAGTKTLIVTDYAYRMDEIRQVLNMIDTPNQAKQLRFRTLNYMKPSEMVPKLQELAGQLQDISLQISTLAAQKFREVKKRDPKTGRTVRTQVPVVTKTPAATQTTQPDTVFVDTDDRTNRILIAGKPDQIKLINELIDVLDVPQYNLKTVREYIIQNVEASEVIDVINELALASVSVSTQQTTPISSRRPSTARTAKPAKTPTPAQSAGVDAEGEQPYISVRPATNSLLVNATEEQHTAIELVIAHVDVVQKDQRTIRQYEIQYVDTQEIIATLEDLEIIAPQQTTGYDSYSRSRSDRDRSSRSASTRNTARPETAPEAAASLSLPTAAGGSEIDITADQPQISVLETTNSLLVYATPRQHDAIALVIAHADRQLDTSSTPYVVYALENQDPLELAGVLTNLIQETVEEVSKTSTPESKIQTGGGAASTAKLPTLEEQNIRVIPDEMSYSLIVYANKRNQQWISELIRELDEYRPQVLLDCTLVEVTKDDLFKFELDLVSKTYSDLDLREGTSGSIGETLTEIGNLGGSTSFSADRYAHAGTGAGTFTGFFNSDMIQGLLTAMERDKYGRIMARPKILVNDNQQGEIKTENTISVAQVKSTTNIPDTGSAVTSTDVSFNDYQAGVTLTIKPHISKGDMLRLEITLNRTDFTLKDAVEITNKEGTVEKYPSPPDRLSTDVTTVSTVPDGTTIILGGLETIDQSKSNTKVPILGDLPIVGGLFRDVSDIDKQGKLYVFVRANIIRPGDQIEGLEDIRRVSGKYRKEFEDMEQNFQGLQDWPGVDPEPMDPEKVLEEDDFQIEEVSKGGFVIQDNWPTE